MDILTGSSYSYQQILRVFDETQEPVRSCLKLICETGIKPSNFTRLRYDAGCFFIPFPNGDTRKINVSSEISAFLLKHKLTEVKSTVVNGVIERRQFSLPSGPLLSSQFTNASRRALGFSYGITGIREYWCEQRYRQLKVKYGAETAQIITRAEMGFQTCGVGGNLYQPELQILELRESLLRPSPKTSQTTLADIVSKKSRKVYESEIRNKFILELI